MQPPVAPIGLDYLAEALHAAGHAVELLDLCWEVDPKSAINQFFKSSDFGLIGMTLRNTDDCAFTSRQSFIREFTELVTTVWENSSAPIALGGVGFSIMPESILAHSKADFGVWGEGEFALPRLAACLAENLPYQDLPNLIWRRDGKWQRNPPDWNTAGDLPLMSRTWVDNRRYFRLGGQAGFETKRGCSGQCVYCADPVAKGSRVRLRPPAAVADELEQLIGQGIDVLHTCDGEFNIPENHALEICREISRHGLGSRCAGTPTARRRHFRGSLPPACAPQDAWESISGSTMERNHAEAARTRFQPGRNISTRHAGLRNRGWRSCSTCCLALRERPERAWSRR